MIKKWSNRLLHGADYNYEQWISDPDVLKQDLDLMKKSRSNVMCIGVFSWSFYESVEGKYDFQHLDRMMDSLAENGIHAVLATPSGSKPAWMSKTYPSSCRVNVDGIREHHGYRHNHCRSSKEYRDAVLRMNRLLAERYGKHPALLMWHVSNEYNGVPCYCEDCLRAFWGWLEKKYGTLENLNRAWWTTFWSHQFTSWDQIYPKDQSIHGMTIDWQRFISDYTIEFFEHEIVPLREITPDVPITTNFMTPDVGIDYWKFAEHFDVVSWNSYPRWHYANDIREGIKTAFFHDLAWSYQGKPFMLMESSPGATNWQGTSKPKRKGMHILSSLQAIAHGSDTVQYFQWRQSRGGEEKFHDAVVSHIGDDSSRVFRDVAQVGEVLSKLEEVADSGKKCDVAIVYDYENSWALDAAQLPGNDEKKYQEECIRHYGAFWRAGISVDIVNSTLSDFSNYRLLVIPMLYMYNDTFADRLRAFVEAGGTVAATYLTGLVDENDLCRLGGTPGNLKDLFGCYVEYTDVLVPGEEQNFVSSEKSILGDGEFRVSYYADVIQITDGSVEGTYSCGDIKGSPALVSNKYKQGKTWYVGVRSSDDFLDKFYTAICREADIRPGVEWDIPDGVSVQYRYSHEAEFLFVMNFNDREVSISIGTAEYTDMISAAKCEESFVLPAYGCRILKNLLLDV